MEIITIKEHYIKDHGKPVLCVTKDNEYYVFRSQTEAADVLKLNSANISRAISGNRGHSGYSWYDLNSEKAQNIISEFQSKGINATTPSNPENEIIISPLIPTRPKLKFRIVSKSETKT